ncbi:pfs domain-containing protein [Dendryphion nanum]|uniref:Pfs domain-containing protein n=1 Tax=Dendryphion nanum TaxID=256645 RepID=A0A9P9IBF5_9PLEO|nr:pfs domain-containing protein [Dendryphion nanum]
MPPKLRPEDYTVGWVCALSVELAAAQEMLDEEHGTPQSNAYDTNIYTCGRVGEHNVVIVCLPEGQMGTNSAATVAAQMKSAFTSARFGLMVGIGGGVPNEETDIRLGDVVVSKPLKTHGGVVQYDFGKATPSGFERTGCSMPPPTILLNAVANLKAQHVRGKCRLLEYVSKLSNLPGFNREATGPDDLFETNYDHQGGSTCDKCSKRHLKTRNPRAKEVVVHYGTIASGNQVMRNAAERDKVSAELDNVLCFEMEAAGLMNSFPCLVIRGICDYADSHKNKQWQAYAAGTAAAYAKELLSVIPGAEVAKTSTVEETVQIPSRHQHSSRPSLSKEQREILLDSLRFDQIDARHMTIRNAHAKTCKWLLKSSEFLDWLDVTKLHEHHGFLWIKGKPGTGKSTLMKFVLANAYKMMKGKIMISFFFNARGEEIEKTTIGTYRSLLLQILKQLPALQKVFELPGVPELDSSDSNIHHHWEIETLKKLLEQAILGLGESSVVCFIDALDECDEEQIRDMISFFESVGELAVTNSVHFQVCFSSRHYPHITIQRGLGLVLEGKEGHAQDITNYLETELKIGKSKVAQEIRDEIQGKASGIFM